MARLQKSAARQGAENDVAMPQARKRLEKELQGLAKKAKTETQGRRARRQLSVLAQASVLLLLLGVYAHVSQLVLSPVFGAIPSSIWHARILMVGSFMGWSGNLALRQLLPIRTAQLIPLVALYTPALQYFLCNQSSRLGARWGPAVVEGCTLLPLTVSTAATVADMFEKTRLTVLPSFLADAAPGIGSWGLLCWSEYFASSFLPANMGKMLATTRMGLELGICAMYSILGRSRYLVLALPPVLHTLLMNPHVTSPSATSALVDSLMSDGWLLMERRESLTGYLSVVQNVRDGFRVMRCDHSLLGGEWLQSHGGSLPEPVYGVFAMLEAVRLVERETPLPDADAHALVIGLGVGTTPSALVTHGINTTVVEVDPVVHELAAKYFALKENNAPVLEDAIGYTSRLAQAAPETLDYIVHDVFTGGAEPVDLFTLEFFSGLGALLKPGGVIAIVRAATCPDATPCGGFFMFYFWLLIQIFFALVLIMASQNYAGDLALPVPGIIVRTINQVFPSCRVFRELPPEDGAGEAEISINNGDFSNLVIFCRKAATSLRFRAPTSQDSLRSLSRQEFLQLKHEVPMAKFLSTDKPTVLRRNDTRKVIKWHEQSALGHWALMRKAVPARIWEQW